MKKVISYICFQNAELFENWQLQNPDLQVYNITPFLSGIELDGESDITLRMNGTTNVSVFVTYGKEVEDCDY